MNATIARLAIQAMFGRKRGLAIVLIPVVLIALALVIRLLTSEGTAYDELMADLGLTLALPLVALLVTTSVLGPEIDDGSIVYLLAKPVSRYRVAVSKYVPALAATWAFGALPLLVVGLIVDLSDPRSAVAYLLGAMVSGAAYCALFLTMCAFSRHAVVLGLLFVFLWEGLLGGLMDGVRWISIAQWGKQVAAEVTDRIDLLDRVVGLPYALGATVLVTIAGVGLAGRMLARFSITGET